MRSDFVGRVGRAVFFRVERRTLFAKLGLAIILIGAIFLRTHNVSQTVDFDIDQGMDLLLARKIAYEGHRPLVGPILSVENFYVPPLYTYILAGFLWIAKTPEAVVGVFVVVSLFSLVIIYKIGERIIDYKYGLIVTGLYAISNQMIAHGRTIWQPHLLQFFLLASLYFIVTSYLSKKLPYLFLGVVCYALATSIYPAPLLLMPYMITRVFHVFRALHFSRMRAASSTSILLLGVGVVVYAPQLVFEIANNFPTLHVLFSPAFGYLRGFLEQYAISVLLLLDDFLAFKLVFPLNYPIFILFYVATASALFLWLWVAPRDGMSKTLMVNRSTRFTLNPIWLVIGSFFILVFRGEIYSHRLWGYFPFLFLALGLIIRYGLARTFFCSRIVVLVLLFFYVLGNGLTTQQWISPQLKRNTSRQSRDIASFIVSSMQARKQTGGDTEILLYTPYDSWNWYLYPVLYFIIEETQYHVSLNEAGNDIKYHWELNYTKEANIYLICRGFYEYVDIKKGCLKTFFLRNPEYMIIRKKLFEDNTILYILSRVDET